ncbi:MAG: hypothetical protein ACTSU2_07070 [Promethearchaeota archaeon]
MELDDEMKELDGLENYFGNLFREAREKIINENKKKYERYKYLRFKFSKRD